ncbi:Oxidoreductase, FAD-binding protein [Pseudomonas cichorii]|uniref:Oxidoreductase, FAD-binding protein n=1 Tax=Pseudomonas cichorii TaxID=36746 RepID=A0A3M4VQW4_PSECI|nr:Oxidoreductase, FAD-binding protein [Pseudomonas cichorii]
MAREPAAQIAAARKELESLLPWVDLSQAQWATLRVDRAEPAQSGLVRPDNAFVDVQQRLMIGWPTKLALAPDFADRVLAALSKDGIQPTPQPAMNDLPLPPLAIPVWDELLP